MDGTTAEPMDRRYAETNLPGRLDQTGRFHTEDAMQPINRLVRHFKNDRTAVVTKAGKDMRWLRWLAESKLLRDHFIDGLPMEMFHAELRVSMRAQAVNPPLTREESRFVYGA